MLALNVEKPYINSVNFKQLYQAWLSCQIRKAGSRAAQKYEIGLLDNLWSTLENLQNARYSATSSYSFVTTQTKLREIHVAYFGDRVVQHYLVPLLEKIWEPKFIYDVYSNRKTKGTHKAVERCQTFMRKADVKYYLQLDIKFFFYTIQQQKLIELIQKVLRKASIKKQLTQAQANFYQWLSICFIHADFRQANVLSPYLAKKIPTHKQLTKQPKGIGLPIGNLTSQFFANVYLNELDQFVKHRLKCKYYLRFVDDFILMADNHQQLQRWQQQIEYFLAKKLQLELKEQKILQSVNSGANFLGYIIRPHYKLVRKRVVNNLKQKHITFTKQLISDNQQKNTQTLNLSPLFIAQITATIASYIGHFKHASSLKLITGLWQSTPWLNDLFYFDKSCYQLCLKYSPIKTMGFKQQVLFFRHHYPQAKLKIQLGKTTQVFLPTTSLITQTLIFNQKGLNKRGIRHREVTQIINFNQGNNHE